MAPVLSVSIDLDEVACYHAIHGLDDGEDGSTASRAVWTHAVPRFLELFERLALRATFFTIGTSLDPEVGVPGLKAIAAAGHEVANHSHNHRYDLLRRGPEQRRDEIVRAGRAIEDAIGIRPLGFRAPGYNIDSSLTDLLTELNYVYDSSVFPCPSYYMAKAAALAAIRARGRRSQSLMGPKEVLLAPTEPYVVGSAFWRKQRQWLGRDKRKNRGIVELPVAVLPGVRAPFIGTALSLAGPRAAALMARAMVHRKFVGLELHGIDLLDDQDEGLESLGPYQPDLRVPLERKLACFEAAITTLTRGGARTMTCLHGARQFR